MLNVLNVKKYIVGGITMPEKSMMMVFTIVLMENVQRDIKE